MGELTERLAEIARKQEEEASEQEREASEQEITFLNAMMALATLPVELNGFTMYFERLTVVEGSSKRVVICTFRSQAAKVVHFSLGLPATAR